MSDNRYVSCKDEASGLRFVFKRDRDAPDLLHIYARHLTAPEDAISTFFASKPTYNAERNRFETWSSNHGLFWFWLKEGSVCMVISCFRRDEAT